MEFSRPEYWSELPFLSPGDLSDPGFEPRSPALQADALPTKPPGKPFVKVRFGLEISVLLSYHSLDCIVQIIIAIFFVNQYISVKSE